MNTQISKKVFNAALIKTSEYPSNFIPKDANTFSAGEQSEEQRVTIKGFFFRWRNTYSRKYSTKITIGTY